MFFESAKVYRKISHKRQTNWWRHSRYLMDLMDCLSNQAARREGQNLAASELASDSMTSRRRDQQQQHNATISNEKKITKMLWRHVSQINDTPLDAFCTTKFQTEEDLLAVTPCSHEPTSTDADSAAAFLDTKKLWNHACSNCCCCFMVRKQQRHSSFPMSGNYVCKQ